MEIEVNGDRRQVPVSANLAEILVFLGLPKDRVAVELDRKIVRKTEWESCRVEPGAELEVVHFVGGGSGVRRLHTDPKR